ncbi:Basic helix-loop-helix transcription factor [Heracleum sosnowskyi]|uniref:Basic helix-loop-helix transcription factor n=1 Tax=Heracleum sosnowskyi TaxID=360622 RepID=A0AAD8N8B1_9APIA|nr:Basic helix-loop-helix transcription factor [Heracleum sosnowskyi]
MSTAASSPGSANGNKLDRKTVERNRRMHMKGLCLRLTSLVPPHYFEPSKDLLSQQDQLDQTAAYIKELKERIDELKAKKELLALMNIDGNTSSTPIPASFIVPVVELRELGSSNIEVVVVSGFDKNFRLCDIISVLQEEGTDVISTNISRAGDRVFHTLHAQVKVCRVGVDTTRIWQRLQEIMSFPYLCGDLQSLF